MSNEQRAKFIADQCKPCTDDFYSGIYQGVLLALEAEERGKQNLNFGQAIEALKKGKAIAREGWNGKGMFVFLEKGRFNFDLLGFEENEDINPDHQSTIDGVSISLFNPVKCSDVSLPYCKMKSASGAIVNGWLASQTDMLSEDWCILD